MPRGRVRSHARRSVRPGRPAPLRAASVVAAQASCSCIHGDQIGEAMIESVAILDLPGVRAQLCPKAPPNDNPNVSLGRFCRSV